MPPFTHVLFKSDAIALRYENEQYSVRATRDIKTGTLVLLEHVISDENMGKVIASVMTDKSLCDDLYPREATADASKKTSMNVFRFGDENVLGNFFSKFNHSCIPTCHMDSADKLEMDKCFDIRVYGMWTHRNIKAGDELTIDYVNGHGEVHDLLSEHFGFACKCTKEFIGQSKKRADIHKDLGERFRKNDEVRIQEIVDRYSYTRVGMDIMSRHYLAKEGYFEGDDELYVYRDPKKKEDHGKNLAKIARALKR